MLQTNPPIRMLLFNKIKLVNKIPPLIQIRPLKILQQTAPHLPIQLIQPQQTTRPTKQ